jgi:outer membrane immunogenic protein
MITKPSLTVIGSLLLSAALAAPALAGGKNAPVIEPAPAVPLATAYNWSGLYGGVHLGTVSPRASSTTGTASNEPFNESMAYGVFGGYQWQRSNLVFGAEAGYSFYNGEFTNFPGFFIGNIAEARARVGYALDRVLISASLGYATQTYNGAPLSLSGLTYGVGIDYGVTRNMVIGLEYVGRNLSGSSSDGFHQLSVDDQSLRLRVGFKF